MSVFCVYLHHMCASPSTGTRFETQIDFRNCTPNVQNKKSTITLTTPLKIVSVDSFNNFLSLFLVLSVNRCLAKCNVQTSMRCMCKVFVCRFPWVSQSKRTHLPISLSVHVRRYVRSIYQTTTKNHHPLNSFFSLPTPAYSFVFYFHRWRWV